MRLGVAMGVGLAALAVGAGTRYRLVSPAGFADRADTFAPISGGHAAGTAAAVDAAGVACANFPATACGMTVSATGPRPEVGETIAPPDDIYVDWSSFAKSASAQDAVAKGYVFFVPSATNEAERLVVARGGAFEIAWPVAGGGTRTVAYETIAPETVATYRLFWTSAPFNGSSVTLPSNYGVELHGDAALFYDASHTNAYGAPIYDCGVHLDASNSVIQAYATVGSDGVANGPRGVFVVAYYDSGRKDRYLGCTVVAVGEPDPVGLHATVGAEVRPQNENYDPTSGTYSPEDCSSDSASSGSDPRAPYFLVQKRQSGSYHAKENRVYAIAPTVAGEAGAKRAQINWFVADAFDVKWTLEQSYYQITWPAMPTVAIAEGGEATAVTIPETYSPTLLDWQEPSGSVRLDGSELLVSTPGRFTLKLSNARQDDFWLVPLASAYDTDTTAFPCATPVAVAVGREVRPTAPVGASTALEELVAAIDTNTAATVCTSASPGRNWNPNLYHATVDANATDAFAALASSVWLVNVTEQAYDVEAWWYRQYATDGMAEPLALPVLPQRYKAVWPARDDVAEIVFASGRGSAAGGRAAAGRAIRLEADDASGDVRFGVSGATNVFSVSFAFHPAADETRSAGDVLAFELDGERLTFAVKAPQTAQERAVCTLACAGSSLDVACPTSCWTRFLAVVTTNELALYADERLVSSCALPARDGASGYATLTVGSSATNAAACGVALDDICAWDTVFSDDEIAFAATNSPDSVLARAVLYLSFDDASLSSDGLLVARDAATLRSFVGTGFDIREPGAPAWDDGLFAASDGVTPRAYVQNDASAIGYKPNVEHALTVSGDDGYSLFALRTDLNDATRPPYALVEYAANGRGAMRCYRVAMTNEWYAWPSQTCTVGEEVPIFAPYDRMPSGLSRDTENVSASEEEDNSVVYYDRTGLGWARRDGAFAQRLYYLAEPGFVSGAVGDGDLAGLSIPAPNLENCFAEAAPQAATPVTKRDAAWLLRQQATPIPVVSSWPKNPAVMSVAQVLSKAADALPDVYGMKSCAVVYPFYGYQPDGTAAEGDVTRADLAQHYPKALAKNRVVKLIDPTVRKTVSLAVTSSFPDEYGFTLGAAGNLDVKSGLYYFREMPANVADRLFVDITSAGTGKADLCLVGDYLDDGAGTSYLRANSLTVAERDAVKAVFAKIQANASDDGVKSRLATLIAAVDSLYALDDVQPTRQVGLALDSRGRVNAVTNEYRAADHYALVAETDVPAGGQHVVLIENDGPDAGSLPVTFHVLFVTNALYSGKLVTVTDASNALSEKANVLYTAPLGKTADRYEFTWEAVEAPSDGHVPRVPTDPAASLESADAVWKNAVCEISAAAGVTCVDAVADANTGKVTARALANRYWTMHFRAKDQTCATKGWSAWCAPALVEGWVQRVLNAITPFAQRLSDLAENAAELSLTMLEQIGGPWEGDVALNNDNLNNVGLVQLYQTVLNRAESMSIAQGAATTASDTTPAVNKQLAECVARLADLYMTLGGEAYSDAMNPIVGAADGEAFAGDVFCFANQVPSLLDEEIALLRGRSSTVAPALTDAPFYNRLIWNFTKGVTQGEAAYVANYNIKAVDGVLDAAAAAKMYPMGHGDAYGHYLSALKGYYRLLRNPCFTWGEASMMEMLVANHVVNMDYEEEDKFAECAYHLAKIGRDVVKLTALKQFRDNGTDTTSGYFDNTNTYNSTSDQLPTTNYQLLQAFGYGEWACRAGYGALCNWAVANALLPPDAESAVTYFSDTSISNVTRASAASLAPLAQEVAQIENAVNAIDAGGNVIGLDADDIPFRELSSAAMEGLDGGVGALTPYEQMRDIAGEALAKAETAQQYAAVYGSRLAAIEDEQETLEAEAAAQEASYEQELVAVYGRPFADDIGVGKTYEQGYTGPDLYHYMYVNLSDYGLSSVPTLTMTPALLSITDTNDVSTVSSDILGSVTPLTTLTYSVTADGLVAMPTNWTGSRAAEGKAQTALRDMLSAYLAVRTALDDYETAAANCTAAREAASLTMANAVATHTTLSNAYESILLQLELYTAEKMLSTLLNAGLVFVDGFSDSGAVATKLESIIAADDYSHKRPIYSSEAAAVSKFSDYLEKKRASQDVKDLWRSLSAENGLPRSLADAKTRIQNKIDDLQEQIEDLLGEGDPNLLQRQIRTYTAIQQKFNTYAKQAIISDNGKIYGPKTYVSTKSRNASGDHIWKDNMKSDGSVSLSLIWENPMEDVWCGWSFKGVFVSLFKLVESIKASSAFRTLMWVKAGVDYAAICHSTAVQKETLAQNRANNDQTLWSSQLSAYNEYRSTADAQNAAARAIQVAVAAFLERAQEFDTVVAEGEAIQAERTRYRTRLANVATQRRYADMYARVARNAALSAYRTAFDTAQKRVFELARLYDYETGLGAVGTPSGTNTFADAALAARALGVAGVTGDGSVTDGGLWELVTRMDANYATVKTQFGFNNPDISEKTFSLRFSNFRIASGAAGDRAWRQELATYWRDDIFADADVAAHCQREEGAEVAQPGFVIPFETSIYLAKNFFGKQLMGGDSAYPSSAQGVKMLAAGLALAGYDALVAPNGLVAEPEVYLVPLGDDHQRLSDGAKLVERRFAIAPAKLSTLTADGTASSNQLVARSVWNDRWVIVIPAASLHGDPRQAKEIFLNGINGHPGVSDVKLKIRAYAR